MKKQKGEVFAAAVIALLAIAAVIVSHVETWHAGQVKCMKRDGVITCPEVPKREGFVDYIIDNEVEPINSKLMGTILWEKDHASPLDEQTQVLD